MERQRRLTETETETESEPESEEAEDEDEDNHDDHHEHEQDSDESELDKEDLELLKMEPTLYTNDDPGYVNEVKRTCPPHPLFVLKWNRQPRTQQRYRDRDQYGGQSSGEGQYHNKSHQHHHHHHQQQPPKRQPRQW